ncbi:hypothetical protein EDB89DRAFT_1906825 [Lactarius sanguifluus]|nr:hypothetical protein EDB89DRAFT_1906825 [Lactarius sanguifluus]
MIADQRATEIEKLQETLASKTKENDQLTKENDHLNVEVKTLKEALGLFAKDYHNKQGGAVGGFVSITPEILDLPAKQALRIRADNPTVVYWVKKEYTRAARKKNRGETDGNATIVQVKRKRGRPSRDSDDEEDHSTHFYLENWDGIPIDKSVIAEMSRKARMLWRTLDKNGLAPETFGKIENRAWDYFSRMILADKAHEFLLLCDDGEWKLREWSTKSYPSWYRNRHLPPKTEASTDSANSDLDPRSDEVENDKQALDDPKLICMNSPDNSQDEDDDNPSTGERHSEDSDNDDLDEHTKSVDDPDSDAEGGSNDPEAGDSDQHVQNGDNDAGAKEDGPTTGGMQSTPAPPMVPCSCAIQLSRPFCGDQQRRRRSKVHKQYGPSYDNWILTQAQNGRVSHNTGPPPDTPNSHVAAKIGKKRKPEGSNTSTTKNKRQKVSNELAIPTEGNSIRNICMRHWNEEQPGGQGSLSEFDVYFKSLTDADKEPFKKEQRVAQATARKAKKRANDVPGAN